MTPEQKTQLKRLIVHVAEYYGRDLKPAVLTMMTEDLADLPFEQVCAAYNRHRRESKTMTFPLPAQIRAMIEPETSPESVGREVYLRITEAVRKFGYMRTEESRRYVGPDGWSVVEALGGWFNVCSTDILTQASTMALIRERVSDLVKYGKERLSEAAEIPHTGKPDQIQSPAGVNRVTEKIFSLAMAKDLNKKADQ